MKAITHNRTTHLSENMKLTLNYSFLVALTYTVIFVIAKIFNLESHTELRFVNYLMLFIITYSGLKKSYEQNAHKMEYFSGFSKAFLICALGQLWYTILFFIYLNIDRDFLLYLTNQFPAKILYPEWSITFVLLTEGVAISVIVALAIMQYFKRKRGRWAATNR